MRREVIMIGTELPVEDGNIVITGSNGSGLIYADQFAVDEYGLESYIGDRSLTIPEIQLLVKAADGQNHHFIFEEA